MEEEQCYMMFARANVRGGAMTSPLVVEHLLARIDRLEAEKATPKPAESDAPKHFGHAEGEWYYACEACSGLPDVQE